jgi:hypothetical protein
MERGKQLVMLDESLHVVILLAQPMKKLEDEVVIKQLFAQWAELPRHTLHLAAVVVDAKGTLSESTKPFVKLKDVRLTVAEGLSLNNKPRLSGRLSGFVGDLLQLNGEGTKHPCQLDLVVVVPICSILLVRTWSSRA